MFKCILPENGTTGHLHRPTHSNMNLIDTEKQHVVLCCENAARLLGVIVYRQYRVVTRSVDGCVDLLVIHRSRRIVIAVKGSLERIQWDIIKAAAFKADQLPIVFPTPRLVCTAQKRADGTQTFWKGPELEIDCLTLENALQRLDTQNRLESVRLSPTELR